MSCSIQRPNSLSHPDPRNAQKINQSLIGLYFRCLSSRVILVNTARPDGTFLFVVWFIHWKRMIRPFLFINKHKRKLLTCKSKWIVMILGVNLGYHSKKFYPLINDQYTVRPDEAFRSGWSFSFRRLIHSLKTYDSTILVYRQTKAEFVNTWTCCWFLTS
jgi:hypothetical protein